MKHITYLIILSIIIVNISSCHSTKNLKKQRKTSISDTNIIVQQKDKYSLKQKQNMLVQSKIMEQYYNWKGVKYKLGGNSKRGVDCSAFVQITFKEKFGINLPRSTYYQKKIGIKIMNKYELIPGDLVLFNIGTNNRHIGIYVGNNKFIHASVSKGVTISNLNSNYWKFKYKEGRRIITNNYEIKN